MPLWCLCPVVYGSSLEVTHHIIISLCVRKTLDWGGKGGKGGGNEGVPKMVLHDSIFSCDRPKIKKDEKLSQKLSRLFLLS